MGLAVIVGLLADLAENDPEGLDYFRATFGAVNALLAKHGLPPHAEPESLPLIKSRCAIDSYPYSFIHYLRRVYAHRVSDSKWIAKPLGPKEDPTKDPVVAKVTNQLKSHLLCHSDAEGFYLPIDFQKVLLDESESIPGGMLGSSYRLRDELLLIAPAIGIRVVDGDVPQDQVDIINSDAENESDLWIEREVWLSLFDAALLSISHRTAICFT